MPWRKTAMPSCWPSAKASSLNLEDAAMWRALARRQGLSDPALDRLLVSIPDTELARAEERARFWPSALPEAVAAAEPATGGQTALPAPPMQARPRPLPMLRRPAPSRLRCPR